ncbi:MAG: aminotransferase class V-fold PLP-dependent enzyme [Actinomycetota bacterium]
MTRHRLDHVERPRLRPDAAVALRTWVDSQGGDGLDADDERRLLDRAREQVAFHVGARAHEVVFTSGATESATLAVAGLLARTGGGHVVCPTGERPSLLAAVQRYADDVTWIEPEPTGWVDHGRVVGEVRADTVLVCLGIADHRLGVLQPVDRLVAACADRRVATLVDTSVAAGRRRLDSWPHRPDLLVVDAHQLAGVPGVGALIVRRGVRIEATHVGPKGDRDRRAGTPNLPGAVAVGAGAASLSPKVLDAEHRRRAGLHERLTRRLRGAGARVVAVEGATLSVGVLVELPDGATAAVAALQRAGVVGERLDDHHLRLAAGPTTPDGDVDAAAGALVRHLRRDR